MIGKRCRLARHTDFDMNLLSFLWTLSVSLASVSFFGLAMILIARPFGAWRDRRIARARAGILQVLMKSSISTRVLRRSVRRAARLDALAPLVLEVLGLVRGETRKDFVEDLTRAGTAEALRRRLQDGKPQDRQCAAEALAAFAPGESEAALQQAWWDSHPDVRFAAMRASILIGAPPAFSDILAIAGNAAPRNRARALALTKLMAEKFPRNGRHILVLADTPIATRVAIIEGLAANLDQGAFDALIAIADDAAPQVRAACIAAIAQRPGVASDELVMRAPLWRPAGFGSLGRNQNCAHCGMTSIGGSACARAKHSWSWSRRTETRSQHEPISEPRTGRYRVNRVGACTACQRTERTARRATRPRGARPAG